MRPVMSLVKRLLADSRAATAVEYGLIIALVVLTMFGALQAVGQTTAGIWNNVSNKVQANGPGS